MAVRFHGEVRKLSWQKKGGHVLLAERLTNRVKEYLKKQGVIDDRNEWRIIDLDMEVERDGNNVIFYPNDQ